MAPLVSDQEHKVALVVGMGGYEDPNVRTLHSPCADIEAVSTKLEKLGYTIFKGPDVGIVELRKLCDNFLQRAEGAETALFYYSGHGLQIEGYNYVVPIDANIAAIKTDLSEINNQLFMVQSLIDQMSKSAEYSLIFLDACRDTGGLLDDDKTTSSKRINITLPINKQNHPITLNNGLARDQLGAHTFIGFAADPGEQASDGLIYGLSPYTEAVVHNLDITGLELFDFSQRVSKRVRENTKPTKIPQRPWSNSNITDSFFFRPATLFPMWVTGIAGALAGLLATLLHFEVDGKYIPVQNESYLMFNGIYFGAVMAYASWRWGSKTITGAILAFLIFSFLAYFGSYAIGNSVTEFELYQAKMTKQQDEWGLSFDVIRSDAKVHSLLLVITMGGVLTGLAAMLGGAISSRALQRAETMSICIVLGALVMFMFMGVELIKNVKGDPRDLSEGILFPMILVVGAVWHGLLGAAVGYAYANYIPDS